MIRMNNTDAASFKIEPQERITEDHFHTIFTSITFDAPYTVEDELIETDRFARMVINLGGEASQDILTGVQDTIDIPEETAKQKYPLTFVAWDSYIKSIRGETLGEPIPDALGKLYTEQQKRNPDNELSEAHHRNFVLYYYAMGDYCFKQYLELVDYKIPDTLEDLAFFFDLLTKKAIVGNFLTSKTLVQLAFLKSEFEDFYRWRDTLPKYFGKDDYMDNVIQHGFTTKNEIDNLVEWPEEWIIAMVEGEQ